MKRVGIALVLALLLGGCAGGSYVQVEERMKAPAETLTGAGEPVYPDNRNGAAATEKSKPVQPYMPPAVRATAPSPALLALLQQAETQERAGQLQRSLSYLERAQRISPREPLVYLQLARVRLSMNDLARAAQLVERGLALAAGDDQVRSALQGLKREVEGRR